MKTYSSFKLPTPHYKKFFAQMHKATVALGLLGDAANDYYRNVLRECAGVSSIKELPSLDAYNECLRRFAIDAGDFAQPLDYLTEKMKRYAYIIKVTTHQIMQLARLDERTARNYFDAIMRQARRDNCVVTSGETFYLDIPPGDLLLFVKILDTHLRRLKKRHFPLFPLSFNDRVRYVFEGSVFMREDVDKYYYSRLPFSALKSC